MLVDSPPNASPQFNFPSSFEDFFNMDLVSGSSQSQSGSSTSSPHSPPQSSFPLTPPQQPSMQSFLSSPYDSVGLGMSGMGLSAGASSDPSEFLSMYLDDEYTKPMLSSLSQSSSSGSYDFLGGFNSLASASSASSDSPHSASSPDSHLPLSIDPALVGTPSTGKAPSEFGGSSLDHIDEDGEDCEDEGSDDEDIDNDKEHAPSRQAANKGTSTNSKSSASTSTTAPAAVKVGGKGKARKGTVVSGGISKKTTSIIKEKESDAGRDDEKDADDWRPSPEEYKKMSSKEKRQLRNKISARNFRVRRKEYISTLEADIASRDALIAAIRSELGSSKSENQALRQEVAVLKKTLLEGRGVIEAPVLPPPAPLSPALAAANTATSTPPTPSTSTPTTKPQSPLLTPNTQKDLPMSPRLGARPFWGGAMSGGYTPVHTAFVPPLSMSSVSSAVLARKNSAQENINPSLNAAPPAPPLVPPRISSPSPFVNSNTNVAKPTVIPTGFDAFADMNPFTLKTLDAYRMQLWGKMAAQNHQWHLQQQQKEQGSSTQNSAQPLQGLATAMRPQFFREDKGLSGLLSAKSAYPTPPSTPPTKAATIPSLKPNVPTERDAMYAAIASQTLLGKLGSAFWDAFSGGSQSASSSGAKKEWDADKVRKVLEGKAVVRVVDIDGPSGSTSPKLSSRLPTASTSSASTATPAAKPEKKQEQCIVSVSDILEESMRSLSLGKK